MAFNVLNNYIYFYHLDKFCVIPEYPDSITDNMPSSFAQTNALSRSAPVFSYQNSGPRTVQVNVQLHRDLMNDLNRNVSNLKDNVVDFSADDYVDTLIKYLQAAALPVYRNYAQGSKSVIPPMVALRFCNDIFIKGIVQGGVSVTYHKPILDDKKYAKVDVSFQILESDPYDAESVVTDGSFRGLTKMNNIYNESMIGGNSSTASKEPAKNNNNLTQTVKINGTTTTQKKAVPDTSTRFKVPNTSVGG